MSSTSALTKNDPPLLRKNDPDRQAGDDEVRCPTPGRSHAGFASGGSIRIRERETASEPVATPTAKSSADRELKPVGAAKMQATP